MRNSCGNTLQSFRWMDEEYIVSIGVYCNRMQVLLLHIATLQNLCAFNLGILRIFIYNFKNPPFLAYIESIEMSYMADTLGPEDMN